MTFFNRFVTMHFLSTKNVVVYFSTIYSLLINVVLRFNKATKTGTYSEKKYYLFLLFNLISPWQIHDWVYLFIAWLSKPVVNRHALNIYILLLIPFISKYFFLRFSFFCCIIIFYFFYFSFVISLLTWWYGFFYNDWNSWLN